MLASELFAADQAGAAERCQVLGDRAGGHVQAAGELGGGVRGPQQDEELCAALAEEPCDRVGCGGGDGVPEHTGAPDGVAHRRARDGPSFHVQVGPDEDAGLQHQPAGAYGGHLGVAFDAGGVGEEQMVGVPADAGVELFEHSGGAGVGEGAGAVGDVGVEQGAHALPVWVDEPREGVLDLGGDPAKLLPGVGCERLGGGGEGLREGPGERGTDLVGGGGDELAQLLVQVGHS
jgi:hypothetical protein